MAKKFENNNTQVLRLLNKYKNEIFSYLNADPEKGMNRISTIPSKERNENNGYANFRFFVNVREDDWSQVQKYNVRIETKIFNDRLVLQRSKIKYMEKADLIIFADDENLYISDLSRSKTRDWLYELKFFYKMDLDFQNKGNPKTYHYYSAISLLANHQIVSIAHNNIYNDKIFVISSPEFMRTDCTDKDARIAKPYYDYHIDTSHIETVQFDPKTPKTMYWCFGGYRCTSFVGSSTGIAANIADWTSLTPSQLYQRIVRLYKKMKETGKAYCTKFPVNPKIVGNIYYQQSFIDEDNCVALYISDSEDFDVIENKVEKLTEDMKEYQKDYQKTYREQHSDEKKVYQKVFMYLKRHNNSFNPKWNKEEQNIANNILTTRVPSPTGEVPLSSS